MTSSVETRTRLDDVVLVDAWGKAVFLKSGFQCSCVNVHDQNAPIDVTAGCVSTVKGGNKLDATCKAGAAQHSLVRIRTGANLGKVAPSLSSSIWGFYFWLKVDAKDYETYCIL